MYMYMYLEVEGVGSPYCWDHDGHLCDVDHAQRNKVQRSEPSYVVRHNLTRRLRRRTQVAAVRHCNNTTKLNDI